MIKVSDEFALAVSVGHAFNSWSKGQLFRGDTIKNISKVRFFKGKLYYNITVDLSKGTIVVEQRQAKTRHITISPVTFPIDTKPEEVAEYFRMYDANFPVEKRNKFLADLWRSTVTITN